ncbi:hypothetical protein GN958_ATG13075 [Phytophthora infestans]|uniref:Uncharacterized protein n=1 Tax=Phytophthora infestans TaxID=4787 RepID=A0A8S9UFI5_PHYIN|nr:hypothetical protein GN958_ATG13075 [Phytophthora infestans]
MVEATKLEKLPSEDYYSELHNIASLFEDSEPKTRRSKNRKTEIISIITQNVRGLQKPLEGGGKMGGEEIEEGQAQI